MLIQFLLFFGFAVILALSASAIVKSVTYFSHRLKVQSFLMGFLVLGFATTIPEMFVAFQSVVDGAPDISIGNLLGGSILLLSFVMGMSALFLKRIILDHGLTNRDIAVSSILIMLPALSLWDGAFTRVEGVILVGAYILHVIFINKEQSVLLNVEQHVKKIKHPFHAIGLIVIGLIGLAVSSRIIVTSSETIARYFQIPDFVIGLIVVTFGTNLPEIMLAIEAVLKKQRDIAFGDVLGSAVINTPLLGIIALVSPITISDPLQIRVTLMLLICSSLFFWWAASSKRDITRKEGIFLLTIYVVFILFELMKLR